MAPTFGFTQVKALNGWSTAKDMLSTILGQAIKDMASVFYLEGATGSGKTVSTIVASVVGAFPAQTGRVFYFCVPTVVAAQSMFSKLCEILTEVAPELLPFIAVRAGGVGSDQETFGEAQIVICTTQVMLNTLYRLMSAPPAEFRAGLNSSLFFIDEAHHNTSENYKLLSLCNWMLTMQSPLNIVLMSATLPDFKRFNAFNGSSQIEVARFCVKGMTHKREIVYMEHDIHHHPRNFGSNMDDVVHTAIDGVLLALKQNPEGTILCFLDGENSIMKTVDGVSRECRKQGRKVTICPLYANCSDEEFVQATQPAQPGESKVIVATNIVESSITIPGVKAVVDLLIARESVFMSDTATFQLRTTMISQAAAQQRAGRCGRDAPGIVYRACTKKFFEAMNHHTTPNFFNGDISQHVLEFLSKVNPFEDAPLPAGEILCIDPDTYSAALKQLKQFGAIDDDCRCSPIGRNISNLQLPLDLATLFIQCKALENPYERFNAAFIMALAATKRSGVPMIVIPEAIKQSTNKWAEWDFIKAKFASFFSDENDIQGVVKLAAAFLNNPSKHAFCTKFSLNPRFFSQFERLFKQLRPKIVSLQDLGEKSYMRLIDLIDHRHNFSANLLPILERFNWPVFVDVSTGKLAKYAREDGSEESFVDKHQLTPAVSASAFIPLVRFERETRDGRVFRIACFFIKCD
jgi:hypothetical protein